MSIRLAAAVARAIRARGGLYLKSEVLMDDPKRLRLLHRHHLLIRRNHCHRSRRRLEQRLNPLRRLLILDRSLSLSYPNTQTPNGRYDKKRAKDKLPHSAPHI